jgi:sporulation protein YlmC with PRC-barrel domain
MKRTRSFRLALLLCVSGGSIFAMDTPAPPTSSARDVSGAMLNDPAATTLSGHCRGSDLVGVKVADTSHQKLGAVKDIIVDFNSGRITFAILSTDNDRKVPVPASLLKPRADEKGFTLNLAPQKLHSAPDFAKSDLEDKAWPDQVETFYGAQANQNKSQNLAAGQVISEASGAQPENLARMSDLVGMPVKDSQGEQAGEIKDVVLDWSSGQVSYAVLDSAGVTDLDGQYIPIPLQDLSPSPAGGTLTIDLAKQRLSGAPHFSAARWPTPQDAGFTAKVNHFYQQSRQGNQ